MFSQSGISASGKLGLLPRPLWGRGGEGGDAVKMTMALPASKSQDPHPQPLPGRLRACPLPADLKVTKPRQAGVWLGRGAHRVRGAYTAAGAAAESAIAPGTARAGAPPFSR